MKVKRLVEIDYILDLIYKYFYSFIIFYSIPFRMLEKICSPALLYLAFSMVQIIVDLFQGQYLTSLLKFVIMFIFTAVLNILCINGYTKFVWFIVIIPIILLSYISSVLFYIFGIRPGKNNVNVQKIKSGGNDTLNSAVPSQGQSQSQIPPQQQALPPPVATRPPVPATAPATTTTPATRI